MQIHVKIAGFLAGVCLSAVSLQAGGMKAYYTRLDLGDDIAGKYADVVVQFDGQKRFVFSRESSYLPFLETEKGKWFVDELVPRHGDGDAMRPDKHNFYSYVRILENTPDRVVVHWRSMPDFNNLEPDGVSHEIFTITSDGNVVRHVRRAVKGEKIDDWNDPQNAITQTFVLSTDGMIRKSLMPAKLQNRPRNSVKGSPVRKGFLGSPAAAWKFDEGLKPNRDFTKESISGCLCPINGTRSHWKAGISGTALAFDGYRSKVTMPAEKAPRVERGLTVDAWIAAGAYPFEWGPVVCQCEWEKTGYYFGIDDSGHVGLMVAVGGQWEKCVTSEQIPLKKWTHVAGSFDPASGIMSVYIDGEAKASKTIANKPITQADTELAIGLNTMLLEASGSPSIIGWEGLIDEVRIYDAFLPPERISKSFSLLNVVGTLRDHPDLEDRILPGHPGKADRFGASYRNLHYHDLWDDLWFTDGNPDILVKFDEIPTSVVFWRAINYSPAFVTDKNRWMIDQSIETGYEGYGCCEHMSDKQCRFAHARVIENTDARVVVHWRYAYVSADLKFPSKFPPTNETWPPHQSWADEYFTIYPDGVVIRKVNNLADAHVYWQDIQFLSPQGEKPEDQIDLQALTLGGIRFWSRIQVDTLNLDWTNGIPKNTLSNANMELIHFKSDWKVFLIFPFGTYISPWGGPGKYSHFPTWNHWPEAQIRSDGRNALFTDRLTHSALAAADNSVFQGNRAIYGFTGKGVASLLPLSLSWNYPPDLENLQGGLSHGYDPDQRAYLMEAKKSGLSFDLIGSTVCPIVNPCFVIKNWMGREVRATLTIDGVSQPSGSDFRQGVIIDTDGTPTLVVWINKSSKAPINIEIAEKLDEP